jgi:MoxR-like ATPase
MLKIKMEPPGRDEELLLARRMLGAEAPEAVLAAGAVRAVLAPGELATARLALQEVTLREELGGYVVDLVRATRIHESVLVGAGPRATQALLLGGRARAALAGRDFVTPDDVRSLAIAVLGHRLVLRPEFEIEGLVIDEVVARVLEQVAVPR